MEKRKYGKCMNEVQTRLSKAGMALLDRGAEVASSIFHG